MSFFLSPYAAATQAGLPDPIGVLFGRDGNFDGTVDDADYVVWRKNDGTHVGYDTWRANFGASPDLGSSSLDPLTQVPAAADPLSPGVPEPASLVTLLVAPLLMSCRRVA